jgi:hypothetical protein
MRHILAIRNLVNNQTLLAIALILLLPALILCQSNGKSSAGDEKAVRQMLTELAAALTRNDTAALDRIYDEGYTFVSDSGALTTKAQRLAAIKSGELKYESVTFDNVNVRMFGDTAVTTFSGVSKFAPGVNSQGGKFVTTAVFIKRKGRWTEISAQSGRIAE